jgi:non-ribosomal peptide synthase protein (TIGR01720 family)
LLVIHHLAVDGVSWRILLEDVQTAYQQCRQGQPVTLPAKTTAFRDWAHWLVDKGLEQLRGEELWWSEVIQSANDTQVDLPVDFDKVSAMNPASNTIAAVESVKRTLSLADTDALLHQAPAAYRTQINDLLLTALAETMSAWLETASITLELEGHGREVGDLTDNGATALDLSRTVGWFTALYPVTLHLEEQELGPHATGARIKSIKEQLRRIPNHGIGYGILRYLGNLPELTPAKPIPLSFNYLGQFTTNAGATNQQGSAETTLICGFANESSGAAQSAQGKRTHLIEINGQVVDGQLQLSWEYSRNHHNRTTIEALAERYMTNLRTIIDHCLNPDAGGFTPSDFSALVIDQSELDQLVADIALAIEE